MCIRTHIQGGHKKTLSTFALLEPVLFNRSRWHFKYRYLEVCSQDSVNGNTVALTVAVIVTESRSFWLATPTFSHRKIFSLCENLKYHWNGIHIPKNVRVLHVQKAVFQVKRRYTAYDRNKNQSLMTAHIRQKNFI